MRDRDSLSEFDFEDDFGDPGSDASAETKDPEDTIPKSRFDEVVNERNAAIRGREEAIMRLLNTNPMTQQQQGQQMQQSPQPRQIKMPEGIDPEAAELLRPILDAYAQDAEERAAQRATREAMALMSQQFGPALSHAQRQAGIEEIDSRVEGFSTTLMQDVKQMFNSLPPEERNRYDNPVGIEALALRAKLERSGRGGSDFSDMAHSVPRGGRPDASRDQGADTAWKMSDEEFERRYGS